MIKWEKKVQHPAGIKPTTSLLRGMHSTTVLQLLNPKSLAVYRKQDLTEPHKSNVQKCHSVLVIEGLGDIEWNKRNCFKTFIVNSGGWLRLFIVHYYFAPSVSSITRKRVHRLRVVKEELDWDPENISSAHLAPTRLRVWRGVCKRRRRPRHGRRQSPRSSTTYRTTSSSRHSGSLMKHCYDRAFLLSFDYTLHNINSFVRCIGWLYILLHMWEMEDELNKWKIHQGGGNH